MAPEPPQLKKARTLRERLAEQISIRKEKKAKEARARALAKKDKPAKKRKPVSAEARKKYNAAYRKKKKDNNMVYKCKWVKMD